ncbi:hypothetical protein K439DRAFT_43033 [Ramaria rubella]|nr:hypothetical protein K439DRAFT_43033 [Ramaria rubella]
MPGEQSVYSDEASDFRKILERPSPNSSYSFRTELLSDADSHKGHKSKPHKSSSHRRHRSRSHRDRSGAADVTALDARHLTRLFARDEAEAIEMRKVLIRTSERLEQESRRAAEAETRAREAEARVLALQAARQTAQANALREQEALKAYQAQVETARNEILRAQKELNIMAAEKERAEVEAANERSKARAMAKEMEIQLALEQGRREGKTQGFVDGRKEGWHLGTKHAYKEIFRDEAGLSSRSTMTPPFTSAGQQPTTSTTTTASAPQPTAGNMPEPVRMPEPVTIPEPVRMPEPVTMPEPVRMPEPVTIPEPITMPVPMIPQTKPTVTSTRTATPHTTHKRSGSLTQTSKSHTRVDSEFELPSLHAGAGPSPEPALVRNARYEDVPRPKSARLTPSPSQERLSPIPIHNAIPSPRHSPVSPLPGGYIPLQENGRVSLPPPHELDPPPPSPHSPSMPLPPQINNYRAPPPQNLVPPGVPTNAPSITVQEPTPPEPFPMPEPHLSPNPNVSAENNSRSNRGLGRNIARGESPPLPPLPPGATGVPTGRLNKGKQRQRTGPPRAGTGLHVPGRKSPSDTSTEYSQFDIFEDEDAPSKFDRTQLSVIMEGSSVGGSPEPESDPRLTNLTRNSSMKSPSRSRESPLSRSPLNIPGQGPGQGILNDPLEYAEYADLNGATLTPTQLAHRREVAEQLRHSPSEEAIRNQARSIRDDVSEQMYF